MPRTWDLAIFVLTTATTTTDRQTDYFTSCCACARGISACPGHYGTQSRAKIVRTNTVCNTMKLALSPASLKFSTWKPWKLKGGWGQGYHETAWHYQTTDIIYNKQYWKRILAVHCKSTLWFRQADYIGWLEPARLSTTRISVARTADRKHHHVMTTDWSVTVSHIAGWYCMVWVIMDASKEAFSILGWPARLYWYM